MVLVANNGRGLEVDSDNSFNLLGGNISFDGGIVTVSSGTINLGGLSAMGEASLDESRSINS